VNDGLRLRTIPEQASQPLHRSGSCFCHHRLSSTSAMEFAADLHFVSAKRFFARRARVPIMCHVWPPTRCLRPVLVRSNRETPLPVRGLHGVFWRESLQQSVLIERQFSRIFPAITRSLAPPLIPRPAALAVLLRHAAPFGSGFPNKNPPRKQRTAAARKTGGIFLWSLHRKTRLRHLGAGRFASLRAGVSRATSGQIQPGEMTWHSTKTRSR